MKAASARSVARARAEIDAEDRAAQASRTKLRSRRRYPSEDPRHVCGLMCDGQDGVNAYCARLPRKLGYK